MHLRYPRNWARNSFLLSPVYRLLSLLPRCGRGAGVSKMFKGHEKTGSSISMAYLPLAISCPSCASTEIVYSCEPACCFNHVCSTCLNSFELSTRDLGETASTISVTAAERDTCAPTVACARCKGLNVYLLEETPLTLFCASCRALLELVFSSE